MPTQDQLARRVSLAWQARLALQALRDRLALTAQLAHKAPRALLAHRAQSARKDLRVHRAWLAWA
jgi:hypothetical protein